MVYILALWFFIIASFAHRKYRASAIIIFIASVANIFVYKFGLFDSLSYVDATKVLIKADGVTAIALTIFLCRDTAAWKLALLMSLSVLCHCMIVYDLAMRSPGFFYTYYDQLITTISILQMWVSKNGILSSFKRASIYLRICNVYFVHYCQGRIVYYQGGKRT